MTPTSTDLESPPASPFVLGPTLRDVWRQTDTTVEAELSLIEGAVLAAREGRLEPELHAEARRCLHMLGGSVAMFGFVRSAATACELEREIAGEAEPMLMGSLLASLRLSLAQETGSEHARAESAQ